MTNEEIRIAIAEACGWTGIRGETGYPTLRACELGDYQTLPNYPECLNAMHGAEATLPDELRLQYRKNLNLAANGLSLGRLWKLSKEQQDQAFWQYATATARQRAEAFLRTLNLWRD